MDQEIQLLVYNWKQRIDASQKTNNALAIKLNKYRYRVGLLTTVLAAIAGATLLIQGVEPRLRIVVGIGGIIAALVSAVQTFYSYAKRAETHRLVTAQLTHLRRDMEIFERFVPERNPERQQRIREIEERLSQIEEGTPAIDRTEIRQSWPWILQGFLSAVILIAVLVLGSRWVMQIPATEQSAAYYGVKEAIQQGTETWEFDADEPLLQQRIIFLNTWINEMSSQKAITSLAYLNEQDSEEPITIYLSSIGGYTKDAYAIVHAMQASEAEVNTIAMGDCFSACVKVLMSGTGERLIAQNARIAIHTHEYPYDAEGQSSSTILYEREREFFQNNSEIPLSWIGRAEELYYLTPEQAIEYKLVDGVLK